MNPQARQADLIRVYIEAHELTPIAIADVAGAAAVFVGSKVEWSEPFEAIWWVPDADQAARLVADVPERVDPDTAIRKILLTAERIRLRLTDHATLVDRARGAVALIDQRLAAMQKNGAMRAINEEYQDHRLFNKERGRGVKPFWSWMHDRKIEMVRAVALTASGKRPHNLPKPERLNDIPPKPRRHGEHRMQRLTSLKRP